MLFFGVDFSGKIHKSELLSCSSETDPTWPEDRHEYTLIIYSSFIRQKADSETTKKQQQQNRLIQQLQITQFD